LDKLWCDLKLPHKSSRPKAQDTPIKRGVLIISKKNNTNKMKKYLKNPNNKIQSNIIKQLNGNLLNNKKIKKVT